MLGVIFAASVTDRDTGYALTADQVAARPRASPTASRSTPATAPEGLVPPVAASQRSSTSSKASGASSCGKWPTPGGRVS